MAPICRTQRDNHLLRRADSHQSSAACGMYSVRPRRRDKAFDRQHAALSHRIFRAAKFTSRSGSLLSAQRFHFFSIRFSGRIGEISTPKAWTRASQISTLRSRSAPQQRPDSVRGDLPDTRPRGQSGAAAIHGRSRDAGRARHNSRTVHIRYAPG